MSTKELLGEYSKLASRLQHINDTLQEMNAVEVTQLIDKIRIVERKMGLVYTLFKSSVYTVNSQARESDQERAYQQDQQDQQEQQDQEGDHNTSFTPEYHESDQGQQQQRRLSNQSQYQQQEYDDQPYQQQSHQQQRDQSSRRQSLYSSGEGNNQFSRSTNRLSRVSNARDDYQAATGKLSIVALSRERASARWNHGGDSELQTNRPRYH